MTIGKKRWVDFRLKLSVAEFTFELGAVSFVLEEKEAAEANAATDLYFLKQRRWDCLGFIFALCGYVWGWVLFFYTPGCETRARAKKKTKEA